MISLAARAELKSVALKVFQENIGQYNLFKTINEWIKTFKQEISELKKRIAALEAEVELLKSERVKEIERQKARKINSAPEKETEAHSLPVISDMVEDVRASVGCSMIQMAQILEIAPKTYSMLIHGLHVPSLALERRILRFQSMKGSERRKVMQDHGVFYCIYYNHKNPKIPIPRKKSGTIVSRAEIQEICDVLHLSHPKFAEMLGATPAQVSSWIYHSTPVNADFLAKIRNLQDQMKQMPQPLPPPSKNRPKKEKGTISKEEILEIRRHNNWSAAQMAAALQIPLYKLQHWLSGECAPNLTNLNKLRDLQSQIRLKNLFSGIEPIDVYLSVKARLVLSDFHLSEILNVSYNRARAWTLQKEKPLPLESQKIMKLHSLIETGKFTDHVVLPRISAEKMSEICKQQKITKPELAERMGVSKTTLERWYRGKHGPNERENENLWMLWEMPPSEPLPTLSPEEIRKCRMQLGLSQEKLAGILNVTRQKISQMEMGTSQIPLPISDRIKLLVENVDERQAHER